MRQLIFPNEYADRVAAVHVFEHFYRWEIMEVLREWKRVLKPGGKIILELPCMDKVFGHIVHRWNKGQQPEPWMAWLPLWGDPQYKNPLMVHKWGYFRSDMINLLQMAGFTNIMEMAETNYHFPQRDMRFEAVKPKETQHATD